MKKIVSLQLFRNLLLVSILLAGISCDNTFYFFDDALLTRWSYSASERIFDNLNKDSVWIAKSQASIRANQFTFYNNNPNRSDLGVVFSFQTGEGFLTVDGVPVEAGEVVSVTGKSQFVVTFTATVTQATEIVILLRSKIVDDFTGEPTIIRVHAFNNRPPLARLAFTKLPAADGLRYTLDATTSTDLDNPWGDYLTLYSYVVTAPDNRKHTFLIDQERTAYVFPDYGTYKIALTVRDSNGGTSTPIEKILQVTP